MIEKEARRRKTGTST